MSNFALTLNTANISRMTTRRAVPSIFGWAAAAAKKYSSCFGNDQKTKKVPRRMYNFGLKTQMCLHSTTKRLLDTVRSVRVAIVSYNRSREIQKTGGIRIYRLDTTYKNVMRRADVFFTVLSHGQTRSPRRRHGGDEQSRQRWCLRSGRDVRCGVLKTRPTVP